MPRPSRYSPEVRERAVRMVHEHAREHPSQWGAITSIAQKLGCSGETLRNWVQQAERDAGQRPGLTMEEQERLKALERENRELRRGGLGARHVLFADPDNLLFRESARAHGPSGGRTGKSSWLRIRGSGHLLWRGPVYGPREGTRQSKEDCVPQELVATQRFTYDSRAKGIVDSNGD
jgi:transposase